MSKKLKQSKLTPALRRMAKKELKEFNRKCDEDFIVRMELDRRLSI